MAESAIRPTAPPALLVASLAAGLAYPLLWPSGVGEAVLIAIKGTAVGLLALRAARLAASTDGHLLAAVLAFGALGDVLLEIRFEAGVAAFAAAHIAAIILYRRNRRAHRAMSQRAAALALVVFGAAMPVLLLGDDDRLAGLTVYSLLLTIMAATAWLSRFPRYRTGIGAVLFVASDALIAARMGPLAGAAWVSYAIWLLYYLGQLLIYLGVSRTLAEASGRV